MSKFTQAQNLELYFSKIYHSKEIPLLVSPELLRRHSCGQLDLAVLTKNRSTEDEIHLFEIKSNKTKNIGYRQRTRLQATAKFLSTILKLNVLFRVL